MNTFQLRKCMIRDKKFLGTLCTGTPYMVRQTINAAAGRELKTLFWVLHFLVNGKIDIKKECFQIIVKSRKLNILQTNFDNAQTVKNILGWNRSNQLEILYKFIKLYGALLHPLFHPR